MTRPSGLQFFEIVNRMGGASGSHFQKIKPDGLVIRLGRGGILLRYEYLCNFMKGSYGIKKLYMGARRRYGVEEEFVDKQL